MHRPHLLAADISGTVTVYTVQSGTINTWICTKRHAAFALGPTGVSIRLNNIPIIAVHWLGGESNKLTSVAEACKIKP